MSTRDLLAALLPAPAFAEWLEHWLAEGRLARSGAAWHLPGHRLELDPRDRRRADTLLPWLLDKPFDPPWVRDLAQDTGQKEELVRQLLRKLARQGQLFQVVKDLFYTPERMDELAALVADIASRHARGEVEASAFRDATGLGRKRAIQILEFFDRIGYTRRLLDAIPNRRTSLRKRIKIASTAQWPTGSDKKAAPPAEKEE